MGYVDQSSTTISEINHDKTYNRTHDGDDLIPASVDASASITLPVYSTLGDVPTTLDEGTLVWVADENKIYKETGT